MTKTFMDSVESFIPCSIYYKKPIYVLFEDIKAYLKFVDKNYVDDDDEDDTTDSILIYANGGRFSLETCREKVAHFITADAPTLFYLQHYEKVLSGATNYKTDELKDIYKIVFGIEELTLKKPEYYEKILVKCFTTVNEKIR